MKHLLQRTSLFFRTFSLLALLTAVTSWVWYDSTQTVERRFKMASDIRTLEGVEKFISNLLQKLPDEWHPAVLHELDANERLQLIPFQSSDVYTLTPQEDQAFPQELNKKHITISQLNGMPGIWKQIEWKNQVYWFGFPQKIDQDIRFLEWLSWTSSAILLCLFGATLIVGFVHLPLYQLANAAKELAKGRKIPPLSEKGPEELRIVNSRFNMLMQELEEAEKERNLMLSGISHDLRTPLARLRLELEFIDALPDSSRLGIEQDIYQLERTISQFVEFTRPRKLPNVPINLSYQLETLIEKEQITAHHLLTFHIEPKIYGFFNPIDLERIMANLLENARKYAIHPNRPLEMHIKFFTDEHQYYLLVEDNGPGIPNEDKEEMLKPFVRGSQARTDAQGSGLGLAIVQKLLALYDGALLLEDSDSGGLRCVIHWPKQ